MCIGFFFFCFFMYWHDQFSDADNDWSCTLRHTYSVAV